MSKRTKQSILLLFFIGILILGGKIRNNDSAVADELEKPALKIGLSLPEIDNPWRGTQIENFRFAVQSKGYELIFHETEMESMKEQLDDINEIMDEGVDYLVIEPRSTESLAAVFQRAKQEKVTVILMGQQADGIPGEDYLTYIATDSKKEGVLCAQMLKEKYQDGICRVLEVRGSEGSSVTNLRSQGFSEAIEGTNIMIVGSILGDFDRITAQEAMEQYLRENELEIDAIFAHSDEDGLGVLQALKMAGILEKQEISIVSVNGVQDALKAIIANEYLGTVDSSPKLGEIAVEAIYLLEERGIVPARYILRPCKAINEENAEELYSLSY